MQNLTEKKYPHVRRVESHDYERIWEIWMQDHIIQWMSFIKKDVESFRETFERLNKQSDIYVMVDLIKEKETIVGVRRIKYLEGSYEHIAEFCSMGVDLKLTGKGYGTQFWDEFEKIVQENPKIKCIRFTQSGGNNTAFHISDKKGYLTEAVFPDWLERKGQKENSHYWLIERYSYKILDNKLLEQSNLFKSKKYEHILPLLNMNDDFNETLKTQLVNDKIQVYKDMQLILEFDYYPDNSVIQHIAFLENLSIHSQNKPLVQAAFRQALSFILEQNRVKKIELFTHQDKSIDLCQQTGFWIRGEKIASFCQNDLYFNELGVEYSFFDIDDAISLMDSFKQDKKIIFQLNELHDILNTLEENKTCDVLGKKYLANIVYQIVRDEILDQKLFVSLEEKPWESILKDCPQSFSEAALKLQQNLIEMRKNTEIKVSNKSIFQPKEIISNNKNDVQDKFENN